MGMYTELHLYVELKKDTREDIIEWLNAHMNDDLDWYARDKLAPKELQKTRLSSLYGGSYYFDAIPTVQFKWDEISKSYYLTVIFNIKNYGNEIQKFLDLIEPHIKSYPKTHIGHIRYEEYNNPTLLFMGKDEKIEKYETSSVKEDF